MSDNETIELKLRNLVDTKKLIFAMKDRPLLFNRSLEKYKDRNLKNALWDEVCVRALKNWNTLTPLEKEIMGKEVKQKWRNLTNCYNKELVQQEKYRCGLAKKRRRYIHFKALSFLSTCFEKPSFGPHTVAPEDTTDDESTTGLSSEEEPTGISEQHHIKSLEISKKNLRRKPSTRESLLNQSLESSDNVEDVGKRPKCNSKKSLPKSSVKSPEQFVEVTLPLHTKRKTPNKSYYDDVLSSPEVVNEIFTDDFDEDKNFAMMIVPMLKRLNGTQKHYAKIKILTALENARQIDNNTVIIQSQASPNFVEHPSFAQFSPEHVTNPLQLP